MDAFLIHGGKRLRGHVRVHGSKNSSLPLMAAALLTDEPVILRDVPDLSDIRNMAKLLTELGCTVEFKTERGRRSVHIQSRDHSLNTASYETVKTMRASVCVLGPLVAHRGKARVSMPGGCNIGDRPVDLHQRGLKALSATLGLDEGYIVAERPGGGRQRLRGTRIFLGGPFGSTVLGTDNVMCAAALAEGVTTIECAACEPEVADLANMLNQMGANITGVGSPRLIIEGVEKLHGVDYTVMADRIEAGTYIMAAAVTNGDVTLENCPTDALTAVLDRLEEVGVDVELVKAESEVSANLKSEISNLKSKKTSSHHLATHQPPTTNHSSPNPLRQTVRVSSSRRLNPVQVTTQPHPGYPTDLQAQIMALLCLADGNSIITEKIFPDRFLHVAELLRMGANLTRNGPSVLVSGVKNFTGAPVMASDLRASAGLILAGLAAKGKTTVNRVYHLDRGYEKMETVLQSLGAQIERIKVQGV